MLSSLARSSPLSSALRCPAALLFVLGTLGCGSDTPTTEPPTEWSPAVDLDREVLLTTAEVEEAVQTWLPALLGLAIDDAQSAYLHVTQTFDDDSPCPEYVEEHTGEGYRTRYWGFYQETGSCQTEGGDYLNAYGEEYFYTTVSAVGTDDWTELLLEGTIVSAEGYTLTGYAYLDDQLYTYRNGDQYWYRGLIGDLDWSGSTTWSDGSVAGSWLDKGQGAHLEMNADRSGTKTMLYGSGGLDGIPGPVSALSIEGFVLGSEPWTPCGLEPAGWLSVADVEGAWYTITWDAPTEAAPDRPAEACDGCGELMFGETSVGEVCLDLSALVGWEEPW
jgi:hypothetical protein